MALYEIDLLKNNIFQNVQVSMTLVFILQFILLIHVALPVAVLWEIVVYKEMSHLHFAPAEEK